MVDFLFEKPEEFSKEPEKPEEFSKEEAFVSRNQMCPLEM